MAANLADVVFSFGETEVVTYGTRSAADWLHFFQADPLKGLQALGFLNIVYMSSMVLLYFGMLAVHYRTHLLSSVLTVLLSVMSTGIYVSTNAAIPMLALSDKYATATSETQRITLEAAAAAILVRGEDFTPGAFFGLFVSGIAAIVLAVIMLRGSVFSRTHGWIGLVGFTFLTLFVVIATFIPPWYLFAYYNFGGIGGLLALAWFAMTGVKFLRLSRA
jgi:hypothetical protein